VFDNPYARVIETRWNLSGAVSPGLLLALENLWNRQSDNEEDPKRLTACEGLPLYDQWRWSGCLSSKRMNKNTVVWPKDKMLQCERYYRNRGLEQAWAEYRESAIRLAWEIDKLETDIRLHWLFLSLKASSVPQPCPDFTQLDNYLIYARIPSWLDEPRRS
jgi:hypothetical protein